MKMLFLFLFILKDKTTTALELDYMSCGLESKQDGNLGSKHMDRFPWLATLYYKLESDEIDQVSTMVILMQREYALGTASDIALIPKHKIRTNTRIELGAVRNRRLSHTVTDYSVHPEYPTKTLNSLAVIKLENALNLDNVWPICPPTASHLPHTTLFNIMLKGKSKVKKQIRDMKIVRQTSCDKFYNAANVGFGVRGPGCGAPSRYIDIIAYIPWIQSTFDTRIPYLSLRRLAPNKLQIRRQYRYPQRGYRFKESNFFGDCAVTSDNAMIRVLYDEKSIFSCDQLHPVTGHYMFTLSQEVNFTCIMIESLGAVNSIQPYLWIKTTCKLYEDTHFCHFYDLTTGVVKLSFSFSFQMTLLVKFYGIPLTGAKLADNDKFRDYDLPDHKRIREQTIKEWHEYGS